MASGIINFMRNVDAGVANLVRRHTECHLQCLATAFRFPRRKQLTISHEGPKIAGARG